MKTRIISAVVAGALLAVVLALHKTIVLNIALALIAIIMVYELFKCLKCEKEYLYMFCAMAFVAALPIMAYFSVPMTWYLLAAFCFFIISSFAAITRHDKVDLEQYFLLTFEALLVGSAMFSLAYIEDLDEANGLLLLILTFCGAWFSDTGAYFVGTLCGKNKLCPTISPKKTVEGLVGGLVTNGVLFPLYAYIFIDGANLVAYALIGVACSILGLFGDLMASLIKRKYGIKDYGNIMPGHGGAMDRFDSILFVSPFMAIILTLI